MTEKQEKSIRILYRLIENCYITQDEFITMLDAVIEKETQFIPGLYPNDYKILKPYPGTDNQKPWDQIVYTYNTTNTTTTTPTDINK